MAKRNDRTKNTNDAPVHSSVALNTSTWTEILDANPERILIEIVNDNPNDVLLYWADTGSAIDADALILKKSSHYVSLPDNLETSKISAKAVTGTPTLRIKES